MENSKNRIDEDAYSKKDTYSDDEKKIIMDRLDEERRIHQEAIRGLDDKKAIYTQSEKNKIFNKLNEHRLSTQKRKELRQRRVENKAVYTFGSKKFYKFLNMEREYFIEINDCDQFSRRPAIISLHYHTFNELKKKDVLIKTEVYSEKIFISYNAIRVYFKGYLLEDERKK